MKLFDVVEIVAFIYACLLSFTVLLATGVI